MSGSTPSAGSSGSSGSGTRGSASASGSSSFNLSVSLAQIKAAASSPFVMPPGTHLEVLTGQNWNVWSGVLCAILQINKVDSILTYDTLPMKVDQDNWDLVQKKSKAYLQLYCTSDIHATVESEVDFPTFKHKYDHLKDTYGGIVS